MSKTNKYIIISGAFLLAAILISSPAFASTVMGRDMVDKNKKVYQLSLHNKSIHRKISGQITSINGDILTLQNKKGMVYRVDTGAAKIMKRGKAILLSDVRVGDRVAVVGVISGQHTNVQK